jgi:hypothetical protein
MTVQSVKKAIFSKGAPMNTQTTYAPIQKSLSSMKKVTFSDHLVLQFLLWPMRVSRLIKQ